MPAPSGPVVDMLNAIKAILVAGLPDATIAIGNPTQWSAKEFIYFWFDGSSDAEKATQIKRRTYTFPIHLCVVAGNDEATELLLADIHERLTDLFQVHRRLSGTAQSSTLHQRDGQTGSPVMFVVDDTGTWYRHRFWTLEAILDKQYTYV